MADDLFQFCFDHTMRWEGAGQDHVVPGEKWRTCWGISQRTWPEAFGEDGEPPTKEQAMLIYQREYFKSFQNLSPGAALCCFDSSVNQGTRKSALFFQKAVNDAGEQLKTDGIIGPHTEKVASELNQTDLIRDFTTRRILHYQKLGDLYIRYGRGWIKRAVECCVIATNASVVSNVFEKYK
jgi:lysozyme family protein